MTAIDADDAGIDAVYLSQIACDALPVNIGY